MRTKLVIKFALFNLLLASVSVNAGPNIQHWKLDNGARVYFVRATELPLVQLRVVFDAGSSRDPETKPGVAVRTSGMLSQGAEGLTVDEIALGFDNLGAEFSVSTGRDMTSVELRSLSDPKLLDPALESFAKVIAFPTFPVEAFERERARTLVGLKREEQLPNVVVEKIFFRMMYGKHPYAHPSQGTEESVRALTREDLVGHHKRYYTGANAWLAIVGDVSLVQAKKLAHRALGQLPRGESVLPLPPVPDLKQAAHKVVSFPATQSHLRLGQPGITILDPDYFPLYVGNYTLGGGGLVSRLSNEVREKRGLSYSVYSYFSPMRERGPFILGLQTKNNQRDEALVLVRKVLADFVADGPTDQELEAAKKHLTGSFPLRIDSNQKIADYLANIGFYNLPLTYLDDFIPNIEAVTVKRIRDAFHRRMQLEQVVTVVVGGER